MVLYTNPIVNPCEAAKLPHFFATFFHFVVSSNLGIQSAPIAPKIYTKLVLYMIPKSLEQIFEKLFLKKVMGVQKYFPDFWRFTKGFCHICIEDFCHILEIANLLLP